MKCIVFAGPSIRRNKVVELIDAQLEGPIKRGDITTFSAFDVFIIIDGEFGQSLSVSPKEILGLLDEGKVVIGASSMGALRASELDSFGMIGIGWIYERFSRSPIRRDDEVALLYSPLDFSPITIPMVNVEYWAECLFDAGKMRADERHRITRAARKIFFGDRTEELLLDTFKTVIGRERLEAMLDVTKGQILDVKCIDAEAAIRFVVEGCAEGTFSMARSVSLNGG